ncbi:hypothetical protein H5410_041699, partial [Solanum commersonii]
KKYLKADGCRAVAGSACVVCGYPSPPGRLGRWWRLLSVARVPGRRTGCRLVVVALVADRRRRLSPGRRPVAGLLGQLLGQSLENRNPTYILYDPGLLRRKQLTEMSSKVFNEKCVTGPLEFSSSENNDNCARHCI